MTQSPNLALPFLAAGQAQKHVTVNEALRLLDGLVQLSVLDRDLTAPPGGAVDGERYIVASGATGSWAGWDFDVALRVDGAWLRLSPGPGWRAWVEDEGLLLVYNGSAWVGTTPDELQNLELLGIMATADTTNRLAVASAATLFTHAGSGHQVKVNKAGAGDTASILFQTGWSGRAEFGLSGSDNWSVKVSPDGSAWQTAIDVSADTGKVTLPAGFSSGGLLGGHAIVICGERNSELFAGQFMAMGNGASAGAGAVMPRAGKVVAMGINIFSGTAGNNIFSVAINKVANTSYQVALNYSGSGSENAFADFSSSPLSFSAGDALNVQVSTAASSGANTSLYIVFD